MRCQLQEPVLLHCDLAASCQLAEAGCALRFLEQTHDSCKAEVDCADAVVYNLREEPWTWNLNNVLAVLQGQVVFI